MNKFDGRGGHMIHIDRAESDAIYVFPTYIIFEFSFPAYL
jgi:hypothetical protein